MAIADTWYRLFVGELDAAVDQERDPEIITSRVAAALRQVLDIPEFLDDEHRVPADDAYAQHIVHVHPRGLYSIVSLVWQPGQATPIHDHRCWCVVGVAEGVEYETRYSIHEDDSGRWLKETGVAINDPGDISVLVPPRPDIHQVRNGGDEIAVSIHVYGSDISREGTSIKQTFDGLPIRTS